MEILILRIKLIYHIIRVLPPDYIHIEGFLGHLQKISTTLKM